MSVIVLKFGGSSVATPEHLRKVAAKVTKLREAGHLPVVVVSAMGKTTDGLLTLAAEVSGQPHRRELDMLLSTGERISMALLTMAIRDFGHQAISLTGSQAGIITTTDHNQARIIEVRPVRVFEALAEERIVIVGGFAGVSTAKEVTTLGRGGSDTTAISLAAALDAAECWICSDVDGVYTADPRVVPDARRLDALSHGEILELGLRGAKVLAPEAIDYARRHGVTLHARSSFQEGRGTVITTRPEPGTGRAVAVAGDKHALPVVARGDEARLDALFAWLDEEAIRWKDARRTAGEVRLVLDTLNTPAAAIHLREWWGLEDGLTIRDDLRTVTVVGEGIAEQAALWAKATAALRAAGIDAEEMAGNAWGLTAHVPATKLEAAVRAWHGLVG